MFPMCSDAVSERQRALQAFSKQLLTYFLVYFTMSLDPGLLWDQMGLQIKKVQHMKLKIWPIIYFSEYSTCRQYGCALCLCNSSY